MQATLPQDMRDPRPAVLLLHGLCANALELMPLAHRLRQHGYHVATPQLRGYGVAPGHKGTARPPSGFEHWIDEALAHFDGLSGRHAHVAVGGLCMGAVLALALALRRAPGALLLISTTLHFDGWNVSRWRWLLPLAYLPVLRHRLSFREREPFGLKNEPMRQWIAQAMASHQVSAAGAARLPASFLHQASRLIRYVRPRLPDVHVPTLALHASEDDVSGPRSVHELAERLGLAPEVCWFHDSYHMLTLDNERAAVSEAAREFLARAVPVPNATVPSHP